MIGAHDLPVFDIPGLAGQVDANRSGCDHRGQSGKPGRIQLVNLGRGGAPAGCGGARVDSWHARAVAARQCAASLRPLWGCRPESDRGVSSPDNAR